MMTEWDSKLSDRVAHEMTPYGAKIGSTLRVRLPNGYTITDYSSGFSVEDPDFIADAELSAPAAAAIGVAAVLAKNPIVSRRFWRK